jgi:DNA-binding MarR family transcriptional regulator
LFRGATAARAELQLNEFVPFRLNRLAIAVSEQLSEIYRERFDLEIPEWRVLVTAGQLPECTAQQIVASTRMHKTRVSRAVAALTRRKLIERSAREHDAREFSLRLTSAGRQIYAALAPLALKRERSLLACLSESERHGFIQALTRLEESLGLRTE